MRFRSPCRGLLACALLLVLGGCSDGERAEIGDQKAYSPTAMAEIPLLRYFADHNPGLAILKYAQADLDNDGKEDLVVIYQVAREQNEMRVLLDQGATVVESNAVPAPVSDQLVQFKDIDNKPPMEFILQGRKGPKVGYAIFRMEDGRLEDLFGQGMEDCC